MKQYNTLFVIGGVSFIGSHMLKHLVGSHPKSLILDLDKLTYSGNLESLKDNEDRTSHYDQQYNRLPAGLNEN